MIGGWWVHLRRCTNCGRIGCCDNSPNRHATAHATATGHPVIRSLEPHEDWFWCYVDEIAFMLSSAATPSGLILKASPRSADRQRMRAPRRPRVTYANVVATMALFFALGGTAAGAKVWITGADIKDRSLTGADVADRSLSARKLRLASINGSTVLDGSLQQPTSLQPTSRRSPVPPDQQAQPGRRATRDRRATPETPASFDSPRRARTSRITSTAPFSPARPSRQTAAGSCGLGLT